MNKRPLIGLFMAGLLWVAFTFYAVPPAQSGGQLRNWETNNLNVLFIGFEDEQLEMVSVYSINYRDEMQSAAIFFPVHALVPGQDISFREYYHELGLKKLRQLVEDNLGIQIAYHVTIRNSIMDEVEEIIGPIIIEEKKMELSRIFTTPPTPQDQLVLGELVKRFTRPEVYFWRLPRLCLAAHRHVTTDFPLTAENLWFHYRIASQIPTVQIRKVILPTRLVATDKGPVRQLDDTLLTRVIYDLTKPSPKH